MAVTDIEHARAIPNEPPEPAPPHAGPVRVVQARPQRIPPHNIGAEEALLGAMMLRWEATLAGLDLCSPEDFYRPAHTAIFAAISAAAGRGDTIDPVIVAAQLEATKELDLAGGPGFLVRLTANTPTTSAAGATRYASVIVEAARSRRLIDTLGTALEAAWQGDVDGALTVMERAHSAAELMSGYEDLAPHLDELLAEVEEEYDWVIPGLMERMDRTILTGGEGRGKSTLLRQIGICCASGVHPFTQEDMPPAKVLYVDLENSRRQFKRKARALRLAVGDGLEPGYFRVRVKPEGLDLLTKDDRDWLERQVAAARPDLVIIGPIYKMVGGDPKDEEPAKAASSTLDHLRVRYNCALLIEAHTPKEQGKRRAETPYGASLWMRWAEFGVFLNEDGVLRHWRGVRDEREWPTTLTRGGAFPWTPADSAAREVTFARIVAEVRASGEVLSQHELGRRLGCYQQQIRRAIEANPKEWESVLEEVE